MVDEEEGEEEDVFMDDDIWEKLTGDAGGDAGGDETQEEDEETECEPEQEGEPPQARGSDSSVWAAIEATAAKGEVDVLPPRLGAPRRASIPAHRLKHATARQVFASSQFNQTDKAKADAFYKRWQQEHKAHRAREEAIIAQRKLRDAQIAQKKADRLAGQEARRREKEAEIAAKRENRSFDQLMRQGAVKEKAEARVARGQGVTYVVPSDEIVDKKAGILPKIRINQLVPTIKIPAKVMQKVDTLLSKGKPSKARVQDPSPYSRAYKARERK